jgi:hypothetical protein
VGNGDGGDFLSYTLKPHLLNAPCHVCGEVTEEAVAVKFRTRGDANATMARLGNSEPNAEDLASLKPVPMIVEFACHHAHVDAFWSLARLRPPR